MKNTKMNCNDLRELMPDLAVGASQSTPELDEHLRACSDCAAKLAGLRQTMSLLDEWRVPEPSPYFDTRLQARLREEASKPAAGWLQWFRKPVLAISFAVVMIASVTVIRMGTNQSTTAAIPAAVEPGTAVGDLQNLDKNHDLYSDFDVLDDLQTQQDVTANP